MTALPLLIAEEMDADWSKVRVVQAPADMKTFGNPAFGGFQNTGGSRSTAGFYDKLRLIGAQARAVILTCAAPILRVPVSELSTEAGFVVTRKTGRKISYAQLANVRRPAAVPEATIADLKAPERWRLIGHDVPRLDIPSKVNGSAPFGIDARQPGMLHGLVLRAPVQGEAPVSIDDKAAKAVPGTVAVVPCLTGSASSPRHHGVRGSARCTEGDMDHECPRPTIRQRSDPRGVSAIATIHTKAVSISRDAATWVVV